ncbi:hypothetical protein WH47_11808 [Habropoda laboriosa]|uniref:Uncharacterized protein n=1 Tax=Habropoda laboriosa TaxID=597456 RepID=A0A0L7R8Q4_9HYME|nr:hypothetical protein WH47_11808 [Habropoda laboriosa]
MARNRGISNFPENDQKFGKNTIAITPERECIDTIGSRGEKVWSRSVDRPEEDSGCLSLVACTPIRPGFYFPSKPSTEEHKPENERGRPTMFEPQTWRTTHVAEVPCSKKERRTSDRQQLQSNSSGHLTEKMYYGSRGVFLRLNVERNFEDGRKQYYTVHFTVVLVKIAKSLQSNTTNQVPYSDLNCKRTTTQSRRSDAEWNFEDLDCSRVAAICKVIVLVCSLS